MKNKEIEKLYNQKIKFNKDINEEIRLLSLKSSAEKAETKRQRIAAYKQWEDDGRPPPVVAEPELTKLAKEAEAKWKQADRIKAEKKAKIVAEKKAATIAKRKATLEAKKAQKLKELEELKAAKLLELEALEELEEETIEETEEV